MKAFYEDLTRNGEMMAEPMLRETLARYGYRMVVRKAVPGKKCSCVDPVSESPRDSCERCTGTGNLYVDHLVLGRRYTPTPNIGLEQKAPMGAVTGSGPMFLVEPVVPVSRNDLILELVLDPQTAEPLRTASQGFQVQRVHKVVFVDESRDIRGERLFFRVRAEEMVFAR